MEIPMELRMAVEERAAQEAASGLAGAASRISLRYRTDSGQGKHLVMSRAEAVAYAAARMPATFGAAAAVLSQLAQAVPEEALPRTLTDVGAGTGTASWAAATLFPLTAVTCLEREDVMRALGCELSRVSTEAALAASTWQRFDAVSDAMQGRSDLVVASYMLNELTDGARLPVLMKLWAAADKYLVIIEPGTPEGFRQIMQERTALLAAGAHVLAPCAQEGPCPAEDEGWCHFGVRVARTRLQKQLKGGDAPYEDEKYTYMIFAREAQGAPAARVLRHPQIEPGRITLSLCTAQGPQTLTVRKKDAAFKRARKTKWGDRWPTDAPAQDE